MTAIGRSPRIASVGAPDQFALLAVLPMVVLQLGRMPSHAVVLLLLLVVVLVLAPGRRILVPSRVMLFAQ